MDCQVNIMFNNGSVQSSLNQSEVVIAISPSVEESLKAIAESSTADFKSLVDRVKAKLSADDLRVVLQQKQALLKILSLYPEAILDLSTESNYGMISQKSICECACASFARDKHSLRAEVEEGLIQLIQKHFHHVDELNVMSLGTGGCFQELVIHAKMTTTLKKKINWILVDPILRSKKNVVLSEFKNLIHTLSPNSSVYDIKDDEEAIVQLQKKQCPQPHVFLSIDSRLSKLSTVRNNNFNLIQTKLKFFQDAVEDLKFPYIFAILEDQKPQLIYGSGEI